MFFKGNAFESLSTDSKRLRLKKLIIGSNDLFSITIDHIVVITPGHSIPIQSIL